MLVSFAEAIKAATEISMRDNSNMHVLGLGANYPNGLDGTMGDIAARYPGRVWDMPCSEDALTGMAVGMAVSGLKPLVHHGRIEFAFHAFDQIITQAAKWNFMFGGDYPCPLTLRIAMGRQWGNGPQHTFTAKGIFAVPGLKVVCPATPAAAKGLLLTAMAVPDPVIYLESRWLYKLKETVASDEPMPFKARVLRTGNDVTIVAVSDMVIEALRAAQLLKTIGVSAEVIDVVSVYPIDYKTIHDSVRKTQKLVCVDASTPEYSVASEIVSRMKTGIIITCPDMACATAPSITKHYYPTAASIASYISWILVGSPYGFQDNSTFEEFNLPPTQNIDELIS